MSRLIDANFVVYAAGSEFSEEDAAKIRWLISHIPTIDAEPVRHGCWIAQDNTFTRYMCSECESKNHGGHEKYCPNCGAKMDLEVQDDA